jgi:hypothetical protein
MAIYKTHCSSVMTFHAIDDPQVCILVKYFMRVTWIVSVGKPANMFCFVLSLPSVAIAFQRLTEL